MSKDERAWSAESFFRELATHVGDKEEADSTQRPAKSTLELGDIQGFILRGHRMPMVRHFVLTVGVAAKGARCSGGWSASDAPQITSAEDWHVGVRPGTRRQPCRCAPLQTRLLSKSGHHVAGTGCARGQRPRRNALLPVIRRFRRWSRGAGEASGRYRGECARELDLPPSPLEAITFSLRCTPSARKR